MKPIWIKWQLIRQRNVGGFLLHPCFENEKIPWHGEFFHDMDQIFYHDGGKEV